MRNNKFISNNNNNSVAYKYYNKLQLEELNLFEYTKGKIAKNQPLDKDELNQILQIDQQILRLSRKEMKYDFSNLINDNLNKKFLVYNQFNLFLEMYNRNKDHSIADHTKQVVMMINDLVNSIYEQIKIANPEITSYPPQLKSLTNSLLKTYNQLEFGRANQIKENSAMILSDPERPTSVDPVIVDHEHIAKLYFAYKFGLKAINCFQGKGSTDLLVSAHGLKELGLINNVGKNYLYADFKTGSFESLGYDLNKEDHKMFKFINFIKKHPKVELFIIDIHPYTNNINNNNIYLFDRLIDYLKDCKKELNKSVNDLIRNKKVLFIDSNIPKVDIDHYYNQLAELNGIDPEAFDLFKELIKGYIDYLEKPNNSEQNMSDTKNQTIDDSYSSNNYMKNDTGIYLPQHLASSYNTEINENNSGISVAKSVALTLKYIDTTHLTEKELDDFFSE